MKDPLGVSPSKGSQGTTRGKEKILLTSVGVGKVTVDLIRRSWVRFPPGPDSHRGQKKFLFFPRVVPRFLLVGLTPSGSFMGFT